MNMGSTHPLRIPPGSISEDGWLSGEWAVRVRQAVQDLGSMGAWPDHPAQVFGPWDELSPGVQGALCREVEAEITHVMDWHPRGPVWPGVVRGFWSLGMGVRARKGPPALARWADRWAIRTWQAPSRFRGNAWMGFHRRRFHQGRRMSVGDLLAGLGRCPRWLSGDFAKGVRVDPRARGIFFDSGRNIGWAYVLGIDLILAPDGVWCVEANSNTGAYIDEAQEVWDARPGVEGILRWASDHGFKGVCWHDMDLSPVGEWLLKNLEDGAADLGLDLMIREDFKVPRRKDLRPTTAQFGKWVRSTLDVPDGTLVVRRNDFRVGTDWILNNKEPFTRGLGAALSEGGEEGVQVPVMTQEPGDVLDPVDPGLPNLVYKYPDSGKGLGVYFMRARDRGHAVGMARDLDRKLKEPPGLFQPFVCSRLLPGRRIYDVRVEMLLTPLGASPLYGLKREATRSLPERIDEGLVRERGVFHSNWSTGGAILPLERWDEERAIPAAREVGEALLRLLSRGFEVGASASNGGVEPEVG